MDSENRSELNWDEDHPAWDEDHPAHLAMTAFGEEARHLLNMNRLRAALLFVAADKTGHRLHAKPKAYNIEGQLIEGKDLISIYIVDDMTHPSYPKRLFDEYDRLMELVPALILRD